MNSKVKISIVTILLLIISILLVKSHIDFRKHIVRLDKPLAPQELAKIAVEKYILNRDIVVPAGVIGIENYDSGMFVSIFNKKTGLRGSMGVSSPHVKDPGGEIVRLAILSAVSDKRFAPVTQAELADLRYIVDLMTSIEKINDSSELNPKVYGVIVKLGLKTGIALPDFPGIADAKQQILEARYNAGIKESEKNVELYRFQVKRFSN